MPLAAKFDVGILKLIKLFNGELNMYQLTLKLKI